MNSDQEKEVFGLGARVVLQLTEQLHGCHHQVYCNNYFWSAALFLKLLELGTYACGTVCINE